MLEIVRAIELFAGIGGLRLAAPRGMEVVAAYDQDHAAGAVHGANHRIPVVPIDLATVHAAELCRWEAEAWLLSPPCQPFSRQNRVNKDGGRTELILEVLPFVEVFRPKFILMENVPGLNKGKNKAIYRDIKTAS